MFLADQESPMAACTVRPRHRMIGGILVGWMIGCLWVCLPTSAWSTDPAAPETSPAAGSAVQKTPASNGVKKQSKVAITPDQKRKMVVVTTMLIVCILSALLALLLWIMWWSRRTHRLLREPLPTTSRGDELWYLKGKNDPPAPAENPVPDTPQTPPPS